MNNYTEFQNVTYVATGVITHSGERVTSYWRDVQEFVSYNGTFQARYTDGKEVTCTKSEIYWTDFRPEYS